MRRAPRRTPESLMGGSRGYHMVLQWLYHQPRHSASRDAFFQACTVFAPYITSARYTVGSINRNGSKNLYLWRVNSDEEAILVIDGVPTFPIERENVGNANETFVLARFMVVAGEGLSGGVPHPVEGQESGGTRRRRRAQSAEEDGQRRRKKKKKKKKQKKQR